MIRTVSFSRIAQRDAAGLRFARDIRGLARFSHARKQRRDFAYRATCGRTARWATRRRLGAGEVSGWLSTGCLKFATALLRSYVLRSATWSHLARSKRGESANDDESSREVTGSAGPENSSATGTEECGVDNFDMSWTFCWTFRANCPAP